MWRTSIGILLVEGFNRDPSAEDFNKESFLRRVSLGIPYVENFNRNPPCGGFHQESDFSRGTEHVMFFCFLWLFLGFLISGKD